MNKTKQTIEVLEALAIESKYEFKSTKEAAKQIGVSVSHLRLLRLNHNMPRALIIEGVEIELWRNLADKNSCNSMLRWYVPAIIYWMKNYHCKKGEG